MAERGRGGNRGFGDGLADTYEKEVRPPRPALPTDSVLASRSTTLTELATGKLVNDRVQWVAAARCRPWAHHNRDQTMLNETSCADLIDSFKSEGRQRLPAIVRRVRDDPAYDFEIIAGVRRHWTVRFLNEHNYPDFEFLVSVQSLTDEEAFRLADVENRARQDLTDLERARDYLKALDLFYSGKQADMAARLNVKPAWLSRFLELARLPDVVLACFARPADIRVEHAKQLAPLLKPGPASRRLLEAAEEIAGARSEGSAEIPVRPADVVRHLAAAAAGKSRRARAPRAAAEMRMSAARRPMVKIERRGRGMTLEFVAGSGATRDELLAAVAAALADLPGDHPMG